MKGLCDLSSLSVSLSGFHEVRHGINHLLRRLHYCGVKVSWQLLQGRRGDVTLSFPAVAFVTSSFLSISMSLCVSFFLSPRCLASSPPLCSPWTFTTFSMSWLIFWRTEGRPMRRHRGRKVSKGFRQRSIHEAATEVSRGSGWTVTFSRAWNNPRFEVTLKWASSGAQLESVGQ